MRQCLPKGGLPFVLGIIAPEKRGQLLAPVRLVSARKVGTGRGSSRQAAATPPSHRRMPARYHHTSEARASSPVPLEVPVEPAPEVGGEPSPNSRSTIGYSTIHSRSRRTLGLHTGRSMDPPPGAACPDCSPTTTKRSSSTTSSVSSRTRLAELIWIGTQHRLLGNSIEAEQSLREAVAIAEEHFQHDAVTLAAALNSLGLVCKDLAKYDEALRRLRAGARARRCGIQCEWRRDRRPVSQPWGDRTRPPQLCRGRSIRPDRPRNSEASGERR